MAPYDVEFGGGGKKASGKMQAGDSFVVRLLALSILPYVLSLFLAFHHPTATDQWFFMRWGPVFFAPLVPSGTVFSLSIHVQRRRSLRSFKPQDPPLLGWAVTLSVCFFLSVAFSVWTMHFLGLWCTHRPEFSRELCAKTSAVAALLEEHKITPWFRMGGDVIGLARDGDVMPFEHDVDLCIRTEQLDEAFELCQGQGWRVDSARAGSGFYVFLESEPYKRDGEPPVVDVWSCDEPPVLERVRYCLGGTFNFPANRLALLSEHYGESWKYPEYDHHKHLCRLWLDLW